MKTVIETIKELKEINKTKKIKSINGYELKTLTLDITNKHVSVYDVKSQGNKYFNAPFTIEF